MVGSNNDTQRVDRVLNSSFTFIEYCRKMHDRTIVAGSVLGVKKSDDYVRFKENNPQMLQQLVKKLDYDNSPRNDLVTIVKEFIFGLCR